MRYVNISKFIIFIYLDKLLHFISGTFCMRNKELPYRLI